MRQKTFLITGASSGIGLATAQRLAKNGNNIILVSHNQEKLNKAVVTLSGNGHRTICCDLCSSAHVEEIYQVLITWNTRLDGMVYSAGISPLCLLKDNTVELMKQVFEVNLFSFIELVKHFQRPEISYDGARIVAVSSITARGAGYRQTLYGSSKAAMISAVKLMARELMNRNIRINCISPGVTDTPMLDDLRNNSTGFDEKLKSNQPFGAIPAETIAETIDHILTSASNYLTGTEWILDGGATL